jgi:hypothetical protein
MFIAIPQKYFSTTEARKTQRKRIQSKVSDQRLKPLGASAEASFKAADLSPSFSLCLCVSVVNLQTQTKSPLSCALQRAELGVAANRVSHTRRRAMRVMVVVMVQSQHERSKLRDSGRRVNSENSMRRIGIADSSASFLP